MTDREATQIQKAACCSIGTKQCAAICLSHSSLIPLGECPSAPDVWTQRAILREYKRRPDGPLKNFVSKAKEVAAK